MFDRKIMTFSVMVSSGKNLSNDDIRPTQPVPAQSEPSTLEKQTEETSKTKLNDGEGPDQNRSLIFKQSTLES